MQAKLFRYDINYFKLIGDILIIVTMLIIGIYCQSLLLLKISHILPSLCLFLWHTYWFSAYLMFFHEATHYGLAKKNKKLNDFLGSILFTPFNGLSIKLYRKSHWLHHKHLGESLDTEITYSQRLSVKSLIDILTLRYMIRTLIRYAIKPLKVPQHAGLRPKKTGDSKSFGKFVSTFIFMLITQCFVLYLLFIYVGHVAVAIWAMTYIIGLPVKEKLRQTAEHRDCSGESNDYHPATNRLFKKDLFSTYFGAAGFNSHLFHHLYPNISYTMFDKLEEKLEQMGADENYKRISYKSAFGKLFSES